MRIRLILPILLLLYGYTGSTAQVSVRNDSVVVSAEEFRHIVLVNIQKTMLDTALALKMQECDELKGIVSDKDEIIATERSNVDILQRQIIDQKPGFLDRFFIGYPAGILTVLAIIFFYPK